MKALDEIKARHAAITPGPWEEHNGSIYSRTGTVAEGGDEMGACFSGEDGAFVAHAPTDVAKLIAALDAVMAEHRGVEAEYPRPSGRTLSRQDCIADRHEYPCPTVRGITEALNG